MDRLHPFRCPGYDHLQKDQRSPFDSYAVQYVIIGYRMDFKGWRYWDPNMKSELHRIARCSVNPFSLFASLAYSQLIDAPTRYPLQNTPCQSVACHPVPPSDSIISVTCSLPLPQLHLTSTIKVM